MGGQNNNNRFGSNKDLDDYSQNNLSNQKKTINPPKVSEYDPSSH